jgi:two-component sensor histidine kinase
MAEARTRTRSGAAFAALALLCAFLAIFAVLVGYILYRTHADTADRVRDRAESAARIVANSAGWIGELAQQTLLRIDLSLGDDLPVANADRIEDLSDAVGALPRGVDVFVVDAEGRTLFATVAGTDSVSVADREYFTSLRDGAAFHTSSMMVSRLTGEQVFAFSRRLDRDNRFAGAAIVSYSASILAELWLSLDLDRASVISLIRADGMLMARYPITDGEFDLSDGPLFTHYLPSEPAGTFMAESPIDSTARTVSYRAIPGTNIVALAAVSSAAWSDFWRQAVLLVLLVLPVGTGLAVASIVIMRLLNRDRRRQDELEAAIETNTLLFREIHHRVKNNLQSVQSLVRMQDIPQQAKLDLQSRFAAMAAMHEHIYKHDEYLDIVAADYVPAIVQPIIATYGDKADMSFDIDPILIDRDHATPLALLLSELVTNALKYAFPENVRGRITISLKKTGTGGRGRLIVSDDGIGLPQELHDGSMGMRLIAGIVAQLNGTYAFSSDNGTHFSADIWLSQAARKAAAE